MSKLQNFADMYGVNYKEAAKLLDVSPSAMSQWMSGKRDVPKYIIRATEIMVDLPRAHMLRLKERYL